MINIIGGTYREVNLDSGTHEIFGSGLRASHFFLENNEAVKFFTYGNDETIQHLDIYQNSYEGFTFNCLQSEDLITFKYSFALNNPIIYPNINLVTQLSPIKLDSENLVCFGMVESSFIINGKKVVYDPQTSINPQKFTNFGQADELIYILNLTEAKSISGSDLISEIVDYFFKKEKSSGLIIKNGPYGATAYTPENIRGQKIPSFVTDNVFKIGSGDIFTAAFSYYWMIRNETVDQCALYASKCTAIYCNSQSMKILDFSFSAFNFKEFIGKDLSKKEVYLASRIRPMNYIFYSSIFFL